MKDSKSIIYMARCLIKNELVYIGKTRQDSLEERVVQHEQMARNGDSAHFHQAMIDYGLKNWEWSVLEECPIEDEFVVEKKFIKKFSETPITLLNVTYAKENNKKQKKYTSKIIEKVKTHKLKSYEKSDQGKYFLRLSGKLKPVINLRTKTIFQSQSEASELEHIPRCTIRNCCETGKMLSGRTRYAYLDLDDNPILTEGHNKELYIGKREDQRKVKNLITGEIFNNVQEVAKKYNISSSCADGGARGDYMTTKGKYVFCFLDEEGNELITERHKKGLEMLKAKNDIKYVAWHIDDLRMESLLYFKNLDEICDKLEIKGKSHIKSVCDGKRSHVEKWRIAYYVKNTGKPILHERHKKKPPKVTRQIICLNDNRIFKSGIEAGKHYGLNPQAITKCAGGGAKTVYKGKKRLKFAFLDDDGKIILTKKHNESLSWKGKKRILRVSTGEIFSSLAEYRRKMGISYKRAKKYLDDPSIDMMGFEFVEID